MKDGVFRRDEWTWKGMQHSIDDHPSVIVNNGQELQWHKMGLRHRDEHLGPAWIKYGPDLTTPVAEFYYNQNNLHRINGPAYKTLNEIKWYKNSLLHRADGPAVYNPTTKYMRWFYNGVSYVNMEDWASASGVAPDMVVYLKLKYF